jgi:hypothetical protein
MMLRVLTLAALALLGACGSAPRCDLKAAADISFSNATTADSITARTFGASCDQAVALLVVRDAEGAPLWAWTGLLGQRFGEVFAADDTEGVEAFLARWVQANISSTHTAPTWDSLAPHQSTLDQLTYEDIRSRDLPMLCHFSGTAHETCVFWEPAAGAAGHFYEHDVTEEP